MDIHGWEPAEAALHAYVGGIAEHLGVSPERTSCDASVPASACIGFDHCEAAFPHRDLSLVWDERLGWAAAVQTPSGELVPVSYLGTSAVPPVNVVTSFITDLVAGRERGRHQPCCFGPCADLLGELIAATRGAGPPSVPRPRVPSR